MKNTAIAVHTYSKNLFFKVSVYCYISNQLSHNVIDLLRAMGQLINFHKCNLQV